MKVTSERSVEFPALGWAISAGQTVAVPNDKESQAQILSHPDIREVKEIKNNN